MYISHVLLSSNENGSYFNIDFVVCDEVAIHLQSEVVNITHV
jgi:hypothetical protein